ncbi:MAG: hypothetical protein ACR2IJ_04825 [Fluviibacter sp.]
MTDNNNQTNAANQEKKVMNRIYVVIDHVGGDHKLVRAASQAQAIRHAVGTRFTAEVATQDTLVAMLGDGAVVEAAAKDPKQMEIL